MLEVFSCSDSVASIQNDVSAANTELFLTISVAAISGVSSAKSMCMQGSIQEIPFNILVDSGSSHTFISQALADKLDGAQPI